jgi:hypothetical protein
MQRPLMVNSILLLLSDQIRINKSQLHRENYTDFTMFSFFGNEILLNWNRTRSPDTAGGAGSITLSYTKPKLSRF